MRTVKNLLAAEFRANPAYELVAFDQLTQSQRSALSDFANSADSYGVLRGRATSDLATKAVCRNTAALFRALENPGPLPDFVSAVDESVNKQLASLVLDGILEIRDSGSFVGGASAHSVIYGQFQRIDNAGRIAQVSHAALLFGQHLYISDPLQLSVQLYFFNRMPVTPRWQRRLGDAAATGRYLGLDAGRLGRSLQQHWRESAPRDDALGWRRWSVRDARRPGPRKGFDYKIYVSPALQAMPEVLPAVAEVFAESGVQRFKVGADLSGVCRPDKIVAYVDSFDEVDEVSRVLDQRLPEVPVHGVPFSADLRRDGLISWGIDPHHLPAVDGRERRSWRLWVTDRLASALIQARDTPGLQVEPWQFALERLALHGIDTDTWTALPEFAQMLEHLTSGKVS